MLTQRLMLFAAVLLTALGLRAQCTTEPSPLQEDSQNVVVFFHADQGTKGLAGQPASAKIYAHTGVLTSASGSDGDWKYAPTWGDNSPKYQLEYVSPDLWKLNIGDIRTYYGITNPAEVVRKLAFVFRNADCSKEGKAAGGKDIFVDVLATGLQVALESSLSGNIITPETAAVQFKLGSTIPASLTLAINGETIASGDNATLLTADYTFTRTGNYTVTGTARTASETKETTLNLTYAEASKPMAYPGGTPEMGAVRQENGDVIFCLAAPGKSSVMLVGSWSDYATGLDNTMYYTDYEGFRYFWKSVSGLDADKMYMYYYLVDSTTAVGDPYAKLVLDPSNDKYIPSTVYPNLPAYPTGKVPSDVPLAVYKENINDYAWKVSDFKRPSKSDLIIYELLLRDFTGTEGKADGNGTVRRAIAKIPYLKQLGVNAVELLPINEFNGNISWGYNPNFYFAPDKAYGTPDDYKEFIDLCHQNGIAVILDMVFNQSDWMHPWYRMYPVGSNPFYNASAPHAYSVLNDWNQGYPLVRKQWRDVVKYWIEEYKVDGYRFDLVKGLGDNDSYPNSGDSGTNQYNASRVANMRDIQLAIEEVAPDAYFINENLAGAKEENEMAAYGMLNWANINNSSCQFAMGYESESNLNRFYAPLDSRTWGSTVSYMESHDEQRCAYKQNQWAPAGVKGNLAVSMQRLGATAAQMLMAPGAHMLWQFQELGNDENTKDNNGGNNTDPKVVRWNDFDNPERRGLYDNYSELIAVRLANTELFSQDAAVEMNCSGWNTGRRISCKAGGKEIHTLVNPQIAGACTMNVPFDSKDASAYYVVTKSHGSEPVVNVADGKVTVPAGCYVTVATTNVSSAVEGIAADDADTLTVYAEGGVLTVAGARTPVAVYAVDGREVARFAAGEGAVELPAGVYVAVAGNAARKVAVR